MTDDEPSLAGAAEIEDVAGECEHVRVSIGDRVDRVATVTLHRPEARNALSQQLRTELREVLDAIAESEVRAVVLTGSEESGVFVAGGDVVELREADTIDIRASANSRRIYETIDDLPQPVIARLNGFTLGGGCELAQACDVRIAHESARLGQPEINLGLIPGGGGTQRLPRLVGEGQAMRLILSGELISAEEAREIGLVDVVCGDDDFDEEVYGLAEGMATKSPIALEVAKQAVQASSRMPLEQGLEYESELFASLFSTEDKNEGIDAFLEDREPEWQGR
jgi:enoyl-CoA hydratase